MNSSNRGEVWLVDLGYTAKVRPCLVVSIPESYYCFRGNSQAQINGSISRTIH